MEQLPPLSVAEYIAALRSKFEEVCQGIAEAVNQAPAGKLINASEEKVRDLFADFRCLAYEKAVQMRIDAAEAAFSPSAAGRRREALAQQGTTGLDGSDQQRPHHLVAHALVGARAG